MQRRALLAATGVVALVVAAGVGDRERFALRPANPDTVEALLEEGRVAEAADEVARLLRDRESSGGPDTPATRTALDLAMRVCRENGHGRSSECLQWGRQVVASAERRLSRDHADLIPALNELATLLVAVGEGREAVAALRRVVGLTETHYGRPSAESALALNRLGNVTLEQLGDRQQARAHYEAALAIRQQVLGPDDLLVGYSLHNLANVLKALGDYDAAFDTDLRALALIERHRGPDHPDVAIPADHLGVIEMFRGDYVSARRYLERALSIRERSLPPGAPNLAVSLNNLAELFTRLGDDRQALPLFERAFDIIETRFGDANVQTARVAENLARVHGRLGQHEPSEAYFERALAIMRRVRAEGDREAGRLVAARAAFARDANRLDEAEAGYAEALSILEHADPEIPYLVDTLNGLGEIKLLRGDADEAARLFGRARLLGRDLDPQHPLVAETHALTAWVRHATGNTAGAIETGRLAEELSRSHLLMTVRHLGEREALGYAGRRARGSDALLSAAADADLDARMVTLVWDSVIRSRALVLDEMASRHRALLGSGDPEIAQLAARLTTVRRRLAYLVARSLDADERFDIRDDLETTRAEAERLERALAERSAVFRNQRAAQEAGLDAIRQAVPADTALVAFVRYLSGAGARAAERYLAFVLAPGVPAARVIPIGAADLVDRQVRDWRRVVDEPRPGPLGDARAWERRYRDVAAALRATVWDPVAQGIGDAPRVVVVPAGALHLVTFATLPVGEDAYLVDTGPTFHYLSAERDLLRPREPERDERLVALGAPEFDTRLATPGDETARRGSALTTDGVTVRGSLVPCADWNRHFEPLPRADAEVRRIVEQYQARGGSALRLTGADASETAFRTLAPQSGLLHVATHTFFWQDGCAENLPAGDIGVGRVDPSPLFSGLALAGANRWREAAADVDDGLLTADEIATLDLSGVRWVALSACDTGGGSVQVGEGVLGLRRAFQIAGARTLIMSLWRVEDEAAARWMDALYTHWLDGAPPADAVRRASLDRLAALRRQGAATHPSSWGAFVAAGDGR